MGDEAFVVALAYINSGPGDQAPKGGSRSPRFQSHVQRSIEHIMMFSYLASGSVTMCWGKKPQIMYGVVVAGC